MYKNILVPVDGSDDSAQALVVACDLAVKCAAQLHLIHVTNFRQFVAAGGAMMIPKEEFEAPGKELLVRALSKAATLGVSSIESHHLDGDIGGSILDTAKDISADLIVVGSRGHSDIAGLLLGSVSHRLCNSAECSCLLVRSEKH